jgi:hypothetical protein
VKEMNSLGQVKVAEVGHSNGHDCMFACGRRPPEDPPAGKTSTRDENHETSHNGSSLNHGVQRPWIVPLGQREGEGCPAGATRLSPRRAGPIQDLQRHA